MIRAVLDINTIVSGLFWRGSPNSVLRLAIARSFQLVISSELDAELYTVVKRDKFTDSRRRRGQTAEELVADVTKNAQFVSAVPIPYGVVRDPDDADVLACAVGGNANYIVSGDKDLLVLGTYQDIAILNANQFLEILSQNKE